MAASSCSPSVFRWILVPLPAASIIMAMMLLPSTMLSGVRPARIWQGNWPATPTNFAEARACRPSLLMISISRAGIAVVVLSAKVAVADLDVLQGLLQGLAQAFGEVDGAVMPARAADGNSDISPVAGGKTRQPFKQITGNILVHLLDVGLCGQVFGHRLVEPGLLTQFRFPVGVGQAAYVEHQVGIHRHPALETERLDQEGGARLRLVQQAQFDGVT